MEVLDKAFVGAIQFGNSIKDMMNYVNLDIFNGGTQVDWDMGQMSINCMWSIIWVGIPFAVAVILAPIIYEEINGKK